jgi:glycosyltransferase involved in cell wall biosynthesis
MTRQCNLPEGAKAGAAIMMEPEANSIATALRRLFSLTDAERAAMGRNGRSLVQRRFQWQRIGEIMTEVYDWMIGRRPRPDCVMVG